MEQVTKDIARGKRKRVKHLEAMVAGVRRETPDTTTLDLFTGNEALDYKPGHFLTIDPHQFDSLARWIAYLQDVKGRKEPPRAYSIASAPHERHLAITVKEELYVSGQTAYPPLLSPLLVRRTPPGTLMEITGFTGPYVLPDDIESRTDHLVHVVAGSGSVPNWSILKHCLHHEMSLRHTFVYGNKTWDDVIYRDELEALARRHADKVRVVHAITREPEAVNYAPNVRTGRVDEKLLREVIDDPSAVHVFACGPGITRWDRLAAKERGEEPSPRFMETVLAALDALGIDRKRIHRETYG